MADAKARFGPVLAGSPAQASRSRVSRGSSQGAGSWRVNGPSHPNACQRSRSDDSILCRVRNDRGGNGASIVAIIVVVVEQVFGLFNESIAVIIGIEVQLFLHIFVEIALHL